MLSFCFSATCLARQHEKPWFGPDSLLGYKPSRSGTFLLTDGQKVTKWGSEKGSLNRPIPILNFFERCPFLDPSKSKVQTTSRQNRWGTPPQILFAKINYIHYELTYRYGGHQIFWYPRTERALRAITIHNIKGKARYWLSGFATLHVPHWCVVRSGAMLEKNLLYRLFSCLSFFYNQF